MPAGFPPAFLFLCPHRDDCNRPIELFRAGSDDAAYAQYPARPGDVGEAQPAARLAAPAHQHIQDPQLDGVHRALGRGDASSHYSVLADSQIQICRYPLSCKRAQTAVDQPPRRPRALLAHFRRRHFVFSARAGKKNLEDASLHGLRNRNAILRSRNSCGSQAQRRTGRLPRR